MANEFIARRGFISLEGAQITGSLSATGNISSTTLTVTGGITGTATSASYVEYSNVANKPALISGSSQVSYTGLSNTPSGIVSGSAQITALGYATTGSNTFQANQVITGSLFITQNLVVAGSSSIQYISSSVLDIADNIITVNAFNPAIRFGGLAVIDSGSSPQRSGSLLFDSISDQWIFVHQNQSVVTSSVLLMGPETYDNLGNETYISANRLPKGSGVEHLRDSNITDTGTVVSVNSNTAVTGSFTVVTGSAVELQVTNLGVNMGSALTDSHIISGSLRVNPNGLFVSGSGAVGIGTANPSTLLHISGSSPSIGRIVSTFALSSGFSDVVQILNPNQTGGGLSFNIGKAESTKNLGKIAYVHSSNGSDSNRLAFGFYDADNLLNLTAGGNVGIGTTNPLNKLSVVASNSSGYYNRTDAIAVFHGSSPTVLIANDGNATDQYAELRLGNNQTTYYPYSAYIRGVQGAGIDQYRLEFGTSAGSSASTRMTITTSGNVGIGTTSPTTYSLAGRHMELFGGGDYSFFHNNTTTVKSFYAINEALLLAALFTYSAHPLTLGTNNTERMRITSGGNVGIGVTDMGPDGLSLASGLNYSWSEGSGNAYAVLFRQRNTAATVVASGYKRSGTAGFASSFGTSMARAAIAVGYNNGSIAFFSDSATNVANGTDIAPTERLTILNNGNVGIGTPNPDSGLTVETNFTSFNALAVRSSNAFSTTPETAIAFRTKFNTAGAYSTNGLIIGYKDNATDGNQQGGLQFWTNAGSGVAEKMRITSGGTVYINTATNPSTDNAAPQFGIIAGSGTDAVNIRHTQDANNTINIWQTGTTSHNAIAFYKGNTQTNRGLITVTTSGTTYNSVSDYRLKENITPLENGLDRVLQLKPSKFNWIETGNETEGFIAHELQEYFPDAVTGEKDAVYSSTGNIKPQSVDYGRITPLLVKAIQELKAENDALKEILQRNNIS
jgi:hypothetical protein